MRFSPFKTHCEAYLDSKAFNYKMNYKNSGRCIAGPKNQNKATDPRFIFK
jgi:hypothetical protein